MNPSRLGLGVLAVLILLFASLSPASATHGTLQTGSAIIQLTTDPATDVRPAWSPDGRQIAFQSNRDGDYHIYLMNADGSQQRPLTKGPTDDRHPVWMPDGKSILFDGDDGSVEEIWSVNVADGSRKQITHIGALSTFASPSPDGQRISFYVFKDATMNLWTARVDGSEAKPLTRDLASANNNQCTFACHPAAWSPDSQSLVYSDGNHTAIWMMGSDDSNPRKIIASNNEIDHFPWFLADGRLGFITEHVEPSRAWTDAWAYDFESQQRTLLQGSMSMQGPMAWSVDTTKVLFHSPRSGNFDIYLVDLNASGAMEALQGTPVPPAQVQKADPPGVSQTTQAPATRQSDPSPAIWLISAGILGLSVAGLTVWVARRGRPQN